MLDFIHKDTIMGPTVFAFVLVCASSLTLFPTCIYTQNISYLPDSTNNFLVIEFSPYIYYMHIYCIFIMLTEKFKHL